MITTQQEHGMRFTVKSEQPGAVKTGCVILGVFERRKLSEAAGDFDRATQGLLTDLMKRGDMNGRCGQTVLVHFPRGAGCERVLLVGCGKQADFNDKRYREAVVNAANALNGSGAKDAASYLAELDLKGRDTTGRCASW
jgi:leucyl aminopeptidase